MSFRPSTSQIVFALLLSAGQDALSQSPVVVTLTATTTPSAAEPGVTNVTVIEP